jgi:hypothetical protein
VDVLAPPSAISGSAVELLSETLPVTRVTGDIYAGNAISGIVAALLAYGAGALLKSLYGRAVV